MRSHARRSTSGLLIGALMLCAGGCVSPVAAVLGNRVTGDAEHVQVNSASSAFEGMPLAVAHCSRFGKSARYARSDGGKPIYDCVTRS